MESIARIAPSVRLEEQIEQLLTSGLGEDGEHLAELGRLGARLVLQRAGRSVWRRLGWNASKLPSSPTGLTLL
jgi:hypothetical protein